MSNIQNKIFVKIYLEIETEHIRLRKLASWTRTMVYYLVNNNPLGLRESLDVLLSDVADLYDPPGLYDEVGDRSGGQELPVALPEQ